MGKVISTPTFNSSVSTSNALKLPQNCLKTTSKLPQHFWIPSDPLPFGGFEAEKKCLKTFESVGTPPPPWETTRIWATFFFVELPLVQVQGGVGGVEDL